MSKTKTQATVKAKPALTTPKQPETLEKNGRSPLPASPIQASALPPPNGKPSAARAAGLMTAPTKRPETMRRARMMRGIQQGVGNSRISRIINPPIQAKLTVGAPNDPSEKEADRTADKVMRMHKPSTEANDENEPESKTDKLANVGVIQSATDKIVQKQTLNDEREPEQNNSIATKSLPKSPEEALQRQDKKDKPEAPPTNTGQDLQASTTDSVQRQIDDEPSKNITKNNQLAEAIKDKDDNTIQRQSRARSSSNGQPSTVDANTESYLNRTRGGGQPLSESSRAFMEPRFSQDFSGVRVHTDSRAASAAKGLNAKAFTRGKDIYFGEGRYQPGTSQGQRLLGHELTHVIQQGQQDRNSIAPARPTIGISQRTSFDQLQTDLGDWLYEWDPLRLRTYTVAQVIQDDDPDLVERLTDQQIIDTSDPERIALVELIHRLNWVGPFDEGRLEFIWNNMDDLSGQMQDQDNFQLFMDSIEYGAELDDISAVEDIKRRFERDVKKQAINYLFSNFRLTVEEEQRLGLDTAGEPLTNQQREAVGELQRAANIVRRAQNAQDRLRQVPVGVKKNRATPPESLSQPRYVPSTFDPDRPPPFRSLPGYPEPEVSWETVKAQYDRLANVISGLAARHPGIYALAREGRESLRETAQATPEQARALVGQALDETQQKIAEAILKVISGDIDYYDLKPIHEQFFSGEIQAPSGTPWNDDFYRWAAEDLLSDHESREFWIELGLGTLAAAAFIVAEFATLGSATFFLAAGVGLLASGAQAAMSWEQYLDLADLEQAQVSDEFALVSRGQASEALVDAVINTVMLFADAYAPVARGLRGAGAASDVARAAAARRLLTQSERELEEMAARELAERETAERLGRETAERATGLGRRAVQFIQDIVREFMGALRRWGQRVFQRFGFRAYQVVLEGQWLVLYGIHSRVILARIRYDSVEEWIVHNTPELQTARHARASQLGAARAAAGRGDDALANLLRRNAIELSEEIGELGAKAAIESHFRSARLIYQGTGRNTLDLVYRLSNGTIIVVEAKGGAGRLITRAVGGGRRAEQGTVTYLRSLLDDMLGGPAADVADEVLEALDSGQLRYFLAETPVPRGSQELVTTLSPFRVP